MPREFRFPVKSSAGQKDIHPRQCLEWHSPVGMSCLREANEQEVVNVDEGLGRKGLELILWSSALQPREGKLRCLG